MKINKYLHLLSEKPLNQFVVARVSGVAKEKVVQVEASRTKDL